MITLSQDVRHTLRAVRRTTGLTVVVTLTLAVGIGATTAIFAVTDAVVRRPLPYASSNDLIALFDVQRDARQLPASYLEYLDWKERSASVLTDIGVVITQGEVLSGAGDAEQLQGAMTSTNVPAMLGLSPLIGRGFRPDDEGSSAARVVVLGEGLWRRRFAGDPAIVGRTVTLTGEPFVVIGVFPSSPSSILPSHWSFGRGKPAEFWRPLNLTAKNSPRGLHHLDVVARLRPGVTVAAAAARMDAVAAMLQREGATTHSIQLMPLATALVGDLRTPLRLLLGAVSLLLLIACANVANLLLARSAARRREFAVRAALGAGRARLVMHVLLEGTVRAVLGGACGVALAYGIVAVARRSLGTVVARMSEVTIDGRVLIAALAVSIISGLVVGVAPAFAASRDDLVTGLRDGGHGAGAARTSERFRRGLIIGEVALSFVLLTTGALLARSVQNLLAVPLGFDPNQLVGARTWLPSIRYPDSLSQIAFNRRLASAMSAAFGARNVALASSLPVEGGTSGSVDIEGRAMTNDAPMVEKRVVSNTYFGVLKSRVVAGRLFEAGDMLGGTPVAVVNEAFVKRWFAGENPLGRRLSFGWGTSALQTIVGVVADVREGALDAPPRPTVYVSSEQVPNSFMNTVVRTDRRAEDVANVYRGALRSLDPALPAMDVRSLSDVIASSTRQRTLTAAILGTFAVSALLLAAIGLYGVVSYSVAQRTQEFGIRAAIGARGVNLMALVVGWSAAQLSTGIVLGVILSLVARRLVAAQLFGLASGDPWVLMVCASALGFVGLAAAAVPTARAMRVDPLEALRAQ